MLKSILLVLATLSWPASAQRNVMRHPGVVLRHSVPGVRLGSAATGTPPRESWAPIRPSVLKKHGDTIAELQWAANDARRITKNMYPDKGERGISALDRMYRIAVFAIKERAPPEDLAFAQKWLDWWKNIRDPFYYDTRSAPDRFFAYVVERQLNFIKETEEIASFEKMFDEEYMEFFEADAKDVPTLTVVLTPATSSLSSPQVLTVTLTE